MQKSDPQSLVFQELIITLEMCNRSHWSEEAINAYFAHIKSIPTDDLIFCLRDLRQELSMPTPAAILKRADELARVRALRELNNAKEARDLEFENLGLNNKDIDRSYKELREAGEFMPSLEKATEHAIAKAKAAKKTSITKNITEENN
jgi:hypothetical protein